MSIKVHINNILSILLFLIPNMNMFVMFIYKLWLRTFLPLYVIVHTYFKTTKIIRMSIFIANCKNIISWFYGTDLKLHYIIYLFLLFLDNYLYLFSCISLFHIFTYFKYYVQICSLENQYVSKTLFNVIIFSYDSYLNWY